MAECPICLSSSCDEGADEIKFVKTSCNHVFCISCVERALMKTSSRINSRGDELHHILQDPTMGRCPMCRQHTSLLDLRMFASEEHDGTSTPIFIYAKNTEKSSWPIFNSEFQQKPPNRRRGEDDDLELGVLIETYGAINGFGITFKFQDDPTLEFQIPLRVGSIGNWEKMRNSQEHDQTLLHSVVFDSSFYFEKTSTFHGKIHFETPVSNRSNPKYFYDELEVMLQFSENKRFVRDGYLHWKLATPQSCPLDGIWSVTWPSGSSIKIKVQHHFFSYLGADYHIKLDDNSCPCFFWPPTRSGETPKQSCNVQITPGSIGPGVGEDLEWTTQVPGQETITWTRISSPGDLGHKFVSLKPSSTAAYRIANEDQGDIQSLIPVYHSDTLWGNVFCQALCVGLASYHFERNSDGVYSPYISYEHPDTSQWPSLDNGMPVPSRVPFKNNCWNPRRRMFKGDICWLEDYGTTWNGNAKWSYEMYFDESFMFIVSGTCRQLHGEDHQFGRDLVYVNAALEEAIREKFTNEEQSVEEFLVNALLQGATPRTRQMLEAVAFSAARVVGSGGESIFDFNL